MLIEIENLQENVQVDVELYKKMENIVRCALELEKFSMQSEINIMLVDDNEIREINKEQRNIDKETDVLSFPMTDIFKGHLESDEFDRNPETGNLMLGDIIISMPKVVSQAKEYGHSFERELMFLLVHGVFHLLGYDHQEKVDEDEMIAKQEEVLMKFGIGR